MTQALTWYRSTHRGRKGRRNKNNKNSHFNISEARDIDVKLFTSFIVGWTFFCGHWHWEVDLLSYSNSRTFFTVDTGVCASSNYLCKAKHKSCRLIWSHLPLGIIKGQLKYIGSVTWAMTTNILGRNNLGQSLNPLAQPFLHYNVNKGVLKCK